MAMTTCGWSSRNHFVVRRPVVNLSLSVRPLAVCTIEPDFRYLAVVRQKLAQLVAEVLIVNGGVAISWFVAIPGRKVDTKSESGFSASLRHLAHNVPFAPLPGTILDAVLCVFAWPEAEPIVVLGGDDEQLHAGILDSGDPLSCIKVRGVEGRWAFRSVSPFLVHEGVHAEMREGNEFLLLPGELPCGGGDVCGLADDFLKRFAGLDDGEVLFLLAEGGRSECCRHCQYQAGRCSEAFHMTLSSVGWRTEIAADTHRQDDQSLSVASVSPTAANW